MNAKYYGELALNNVILNKVHNLDLLTNPLVMAYQRR